MYNIKSIKFLEKIEETNLTMQVMDGIMCHNDEKNDIHVKPEKYTE